MSAVGGCAAGPMRADEVVSSVDGMCCWVVVAELYVWLCE